MYMNRHGRGGSFQRVQWVELQVEGDMGRGGGEVRGGDRGREVFGGVPLHGGNGGQREGVGGDSGGGRASSDGNGGAGQLGILGQLV